MNVKNEVFKVLMEMGIAPKAITSKASFYKDLGLDSLDFAEMVMEVEQRFNVEIPALEAENIATVQQAIDYLKNYQKRIH
ncbi:MAG: acyl carrier protein [Bacteroidota bacterium]